MYFGGKRVAMRTVSSGTIYYYEDDMLGTARTMVQAGQTTPCFDADFLPYGQEVDYTSTCGSNYKFEGKERDLETGDDDFGALLPVEPGPLALGGLERGACAGALR
jgi:hypothetical protein